MVPKFYNHYVLCITGNVISLLVITQNKLDLNGSFLSLITILCVFDVFCIVCNILIFTGPLVFETYRNQVTYSNSIEF